MSNEPPTADSAIHVLVIPIETRESMPTGYLGSLVAFR
jgi:hypothetical protein